MAHVSERILFSHPHQLTQPVSEFHCNGRALMPPSLFQVPMFVRSKASTHLNLEEVEKEEDFARNAPVAQGMQIVTKLPRPVLPSTSGKRNGSQANLPSRIGNVFSRPRQVTYNIFVNARASIRLQIITLSTTNQKTKAPILGPWHVTCFFSPFLVHPCGFQSREYTSND